MVKVTLDGGSPTTVDTYDLIGDLRHRVWQSGNLTFGSHTVKIECTGTANTASSDTWIYVDAFDVTGTLE